MGAERSNGRMLKHLNAQTVRMFKWPNAQMAERSNRKM
eukprot:CAMPEP_0119306186 /NCGR_PEP_ID=MMETSP1333-20130426/6998_1 /TAXON_ID=418940 /ORGANISM="Scyphosphaera apsteinii, Strain RCC1455" /LENGTH=37 /DNA_ID= /DNA_START= /DNA_END= /DNA_ORIENTATION=